MQLSIKVTAINYLNKSNEIAIADKDNVISIYSIETRERTLTYKMILNETNCVIHIFETKNKKMLIITKHKSFHLLNRSILHLELLNLNFSFTILRNTCTMINDNEVLAIGTNWGNIFIININPLIIKSLLLYNILNKNFYFLHMLERSEINAIKKIVQYKRDSLLSLSNSKIIIWNLTTYQAISVIDIKANDVTYRLNGEIMINMNGRIWIMSLLFNKKRIVYDSNSKMNKVLDEIKENVYIGIEDSKRIIKVKENNRELVKEYDQDIIKYIMGMINGKNVMILQFEDSVIIDYTNQN